jgi:sugar-specific transcriptional regulator TrmB
MDTTILKSVGLTENEIKIYLILLKSGPTTAYKLSQKTGIYRTHIYDKLEQLIKKGLVTQNYQAAKKYFQATSPIKIKYYIEEKKKELELKEKQIENLLPQLEAISNLPKEDTKVEVFKGKEGIKYFLKDIIKTKKEVLIIGIDDSKYNELLPIFMEQYFRDLKIKKIPERVITIKKEKAFTFNKKLASTTKYKFLNEEQFNPTNTFIYGNKVVIVSWGTPITAIMIQNKGIADTYKSHFELLWEIAKQ